MADPIGHARHDAGRARSEGLQLPHPLHLGLLVAAMLVLMLAVTLAPAAEEAGERAEAALAPERQAELARLVRQDCGSCHGRTLKGGLGPPLVAAALEAKPAESLKYTILYGRRGTAMPGWRPFLTEAEAEWIVARLIEGFPDAR